MSVNSLYDFSFYTVAALLPFLAFGLFFIVFRGRSSAKGPLYVLKLITGNVLFFVFLCASVFLLLESYYRFIYDATDFFGFSRATSRWYKRHFHFNNIGARDNKDYTRKRASGKRRMTFLGDSITAGTGIVNVNDRFVNIIGAKKGKEWETHVMAGAGHDTGDQYFVLKQLIVKGYELDLVVLVYFVNDITDLMTNYQKSMESLWEKYRTLPFAIKHSFFLNTWFYRFQAHYESLLSTTFDKMLNAYHSPLWDIQKKRLKLIRDLCGNNQGHLLVVLFPYMHDISNESIFGPVHNKISQYCKALRTPCLDLLPLYQKHSDDILTMGPYDSHPNELAHSLAANEIQLFLEKNMPLNKGSKNAKNENSHF